MYDEILYESQFEEGICIVYNNINYSFSKLTGTKNEVIKKDYDLSDFSSIWKRHKKFLWNIIHISINFLLTIITCSIYEFVLTMIVNHIILFKLFWGKLQ